MYPYTTWDGPARWINGALLTVVTIILFDALLRLLGANEGNAVVALFRTLATLVLTPFAGMFPDQRFLLTLLVALLGYSLLAALLIGVVGGLTRSRAGGREVVERRRDVH